MDYRELVGNTEEYPYSAICSLEIFNKAGKLYYGTGFLAGPKLVLTAGHNVYYHADGGFMDAIRVYPGLNGDRNSPPFGSAHATRFLTVEAWSRRAEKQFDIGAIVLPDDLGTPAGSLTVSNFRDEDLRSMLMTISGYPKNPPVTGFPPDASTQWQRQGYVAAEPNRLRYTIETSIGQSGAPIFAKVGSQPNPYHVVGIHNYGFDSFNAGTRINTDVLAQVEQWRIESEAS